MERNLILLIEDEEKLSRTLKEFLELSGYDVLCALDGQTGLELFYDNMHKIDLVLLDIMLPDINGDEVLKGIREKSNTPVIMVTAKNSIHDQLVNFANGADDYITKPYVLAIVKVHIEAILKRAGKIVERVQAGKIEIEPAGRKLFVEGRLIETTPREYELLAYLIKNKGVVVTRENILESVWGYDYMGDVRTIDTLIKQIRKKIRPHGNYIKSVYGVGYLFEVKEDDKKA